MYRMSTELVEHLNLIKVTKIFFIKVRTIGYHMIKKMVKNSFIYLNVNKKRLIDSRTLKIKGLLIHVNIVDSLIS